jgi:GT2 family glycosyltransferase
MAGMDEPLVAAVLEGLALTPAEQPRALAARALGLARQGKAQAALLACERLCRILDPVSADALALRSTMARMVGEEGAANADLRRALDMAPGHAPANLAALRFLPATEAEAAARRLLGSTRSVSALAPALDRLMAGQGDEAPAAVIVLASEIRDDGTEMITGWAAWRGEEPLPLHLAFRALPTGSAAIGRATLEADLGHGLARTGADGWQAAEILMPWPEGAALLDPGIDRAGATALAEPARLFRLGGGPAPRRSGVDAGPPALPSRVAVIVPCHGDAEATSACFAALMADSGAVPRRRIIAVDDCSPDPAIAALLDELAARQHILLIRNESNLGFAASVNRALATLDGEEDALLLNADALMPPGALARLQGAAYAASDIGTVTPLSNNGEYTSLPLRFRENPMPTPEQVAALDAIAARANPGVSVTIPNGIGFCLYVRRDALAAVGGLSLAFGRGYCEDVDLCLRAAQSGLRSVCASDVYVGHHGGRSFGRERRTLVVRNLERVEALHPGYRRLSADFLRRDPLAEPLAQHAALALVSGPSLTLVLAGEDASAGAVAFAAGVGQGHGQPGGETSGTVRIAIAGRAGSRITLGLRDGAGEGPGDKRQTLVLSHEPAMAAERLAEDLAAMPIDTLVLLDPQHLPQAVLSAAMMINVPRKLALSRPGVLCARAGLVPRRTMMRPCCNGWCPLEQADGTMTLAGPGMAALAQQAQAIHVATPGLRRIIDAAAPHLLHPERVVVAAQPLPREWPASRLPSAAKGARAGSRRLVIIPGDGGAGDLGRLLPLLAARLALDARDPTEMIVLGAMPNEARIMAGGVFVTGAVRPQEWDLWLRRLEPAHVFLASRHGPHGDIDGERLLAAAWPVAFYDWSGTDGQDEGRHLRLRPDAKLVDAVALLDRWLHEAHPSLPLAAGGEESVDAEQRAVIKDNLGAAEVEGLEAGIKGQA